MRKISCYFIAFLLANILTVTAMAQSSTVSGNVLNSNSKEGVGAVSVMVKGTDLGTFTDDKGNFKLNVKKFPVTLLITSVGYDMKEVVINSSSDLTKIEVAPTSTLGQEVVVSATRVAQKILESPVSIERVGANAIRTAPAAAYYDVIANLKGVDVTTSSLTFKTPSTRGFNGSGSTRVNQIVDGMDNQAPGLNFSVGSVIGLTQLDVDNMELLPGASSALYGPGGMNGTILITSKNPFKYQGLSFDIKEGIMHTDRRERNVSSYHNWSVRWAKQFSNKFSMKLTTELISAKDWVGDDYRNYKGLAIAGAPAAGTRTTDPNYNGINLYGDETTTDIRPILAGIGAPAALLANPINVSRTGYQEKSIINPNTVNYKITGALHYKITPKIEAVLAAYWGTGNTTYTGSDRYSLKDLKIGQYKIELNHKDWMLRAYTTQEDAGQSYNATITTRLLNEGWRGSAPKANSSGTIGLPEIAASWYGAYSIAYLTKIAGGASDMDAHNYARSQADLNRPEAGSTRFNQIYDSVRMLPIKNGGGLFVDKTNLYNLEGQYNLSKYTNKFADVLIGANFKRYMLNSQGTLFADSTGKIRINEMGAYVQASKQVLSMLKLTLSGRYDKNENFDGRFTPRATASIKVAKNSNVRISYQQAYRFPSTQQQWINLQVGGGTRLLGGNESFRTYYNFANNPIYYYTSLQGTATPTKFDNAKFKPESVSTFEVGYKGLHLGNKLLVDVYGYYGQYQNFISRTVFVQSKIVGAAILQSDTALGNLYSLPTNSTSKVKTFGYGLGFDYSIGNGYMFSANASSDELNDVPVGTYVYFNTPKYRANATFANNGFGPNKRLGFNVTYHFSDKFHYEGDFASGDVPAVQTLDAQVSWKLPSTKSIIKIGANNLLNQYYRNATGNSVVGGLYYVGFGFNIY